jgi:glycosyltransferase 2 family protein
MIRIFSSTILRMAFGLALAAVCLTWVFHDTDWKTLAGNLKAINPAWASLGVLFVALSFVCHGLRWHLLLKPLGALRVVRAAQAVYCGIFVDEILPLGFGEVTRAYIVSVWLGREFVSIIPSMAMERLFEAAWLAIGIGVTALAVPLPKNLNRAVGIFGLAVLALVGIVLFIMIRKKETGEDDSPRRMPLGKSGRRLKSLLGRLEDGFRSIGFSRDLGAAFMISLFVFALRAAALWFFMRAYGLRLPFWMGAATFVIILFGTGFPLTPASIGTNQFFCVIGLSLFGVGKTIAAGFSVIGYIFMIFPTLVIGALALARSGIKISVLKDRIRRLKRDKGWG